MAAICILCAWTDKIQQTINIINDMIMSSFNLDFLDSVASGYAVELVIPNINDIRAPVIKVAHAVL